MIGDIHNKISIDLAKAYRDVINEHAKNNNIALFLEEPAGIEEEKLSHEITLMGAMKRLLKPSDNLEIIFSDRRIEICEEKYATAVAYFWMLEDIEKLAGKEKNNLRVKDGKFDLSPEILHKIDNLVSHSSRCCTLDELMQFLITQIDVLDKLADKYRNVTPLYDYIGACILDINDELGLLLDLEKDYLAINQNPGKDPIKNTLIHICSDMIKKTGSFKAITILQDVIHQYVDRFHDATLLCDLWDKTLHNDDKKIFITINGDAHCRDLIPILQEIGKQEISTFADKNGKRISPSLLAEFLNNNFDHSKKEKRSCSLM